MSPPFLLTSEVCSRRTQHFDKSKSPKNPTTIAKSRDDNKAAIIRRLRSRLDRKTRGVSAETDARLRAQVAFYAQLRSSIFVNGDSLGVTALGNVAVAVLADDTHAVTTMDTGPAPAPDLFAAQAVPAPATKRPAASGADHQEAPAAKKQRKSSRTPQYMFDLPDTFPRDVQLVKAAAKQGKTPPRAAYPMGRAARLLYLMHWRYYMRHRDTFFDCALYAPTDNSEARRRDKLNANQGRLVLVSAYFCLFGWYGFLDRFENTVHDNLMWLGGKAAKRSVSAKGKASSATDLVTLWRHVRYRYDSLMARILDPCRVEEDGYQSIRELLEQTEALDPTRPPHLRLSDEALARVALDAGRKPPNPVWVGNKSSGIWKTLLTNSRTRALQVKIAKQLKEGTYWIMDLKPFQRTEQGYNDSVYANNDGTFTVQPPSPPVDEELEDVEDDESEEKPSTPSPTEEDEPDDQEQDDADQDDKAEDDEGGRSSDTHDALEDDKKSRSGDDKGGSSAKGNSKKKSFDSSSSK
ncbi:hypothetical protein PHYSODRAFT_329831 [Phytophthora sojae]|uniref:Uncharacterized protein n=1 Tax=Phytophthora sojae (strain P6497) TaxID=1094619 RepID=G4Z9D9_PHYSP|nr:hypothetical protein PHYSODRAFT_329831 [Phytophthora sojae]EGZ21940.1 hypothetical protein PHYSODRAFT_329831 [Phytophthora sojae]|eukprot:XP_009524657.1 hypothetical protein PHYSODRAFT_329831 [Phytophthora sojae]